MNWVQEQWNIHEQSLPASRVQSWSPQAVSQAIKPMRHLIRGPADHFPNTTFVTCPYFYHTLLVRTFGDSAIFQPCPNGTSLVTQQLQHDFQVLRKDLKPYAWAFRWEWGLPTARVLPKPSKAFLAARPIIGYTKCWHVKASKFLAVALYTLMQIAFPAGTTWNVNSVWTGLRTAWKHIHDMSVTEEPWTMVQQDLIGFFNSVPRTRICSSLQMMLLRLEQHAGIPVSAQAYQVDMKAGTRGLRMFQGRHRYRQSITKTLQLRHVIPLTRFLLASAYFKFGRDTFRQVQGACMGSPLAPVLCSIVAAEQEFVFRQSFTSQLQDAGLLRGFRYADNRCFFLRESECATAWARLALPLEFYEAPILLEDVPGEKLLGTTTSVAQGTITMLQPADVTSLRTLRSVGPESGPLSGFHSRMLNIQRFTRPQCLIPAQVEDLSAHYLRRNFPFRLLSKRHPSLHKLIRHMDSSESRKTSSLLQNATSRSAGISRRNRCNPLHARLQRLVLQA